MSFRFLWMSVCIACERKTKSGLILPLLFFVFLLWYYSWQSTPASTFISMKCVAKRRNANAKWKAKCYKAHCFCHKGGCDNDSLFAIFWHSINFVFSDFILYWWPTANLGINFSASVVLSWGGKPDLNLCFLPRVAQHSEGGGCGGVVGSTRM